MKNIRLISILSVFVALAFSGCATSGLNAKLDPVTTELVIGAATDGAGLILRRNAKAVPPLRALSAGIGAVLTEDSLTDERVQAFVSKITKDSGLDVEEQFFLERLVVRVHRLLTAKFGTPDLNIKNPAVKADLERLKLAIDEMLAAYDVRTK
jgi:hypothetical protein